MSSLFWRETFERAIKTAAQSALLVFGGDQVNAIEADWRKAAGFAVGGLVISVLTSLASTTHGDASSPSLVEPQR